MANYSWLTLEQAQSQLAQRLNDTSMVRWTQPELTIYIQQSLRLYNCLVWTWKTDFTFNTSNLWTSLGSIAGSPRLRTQTDTNCYTQMQYMLLEPASGGVWTGTNQFNISQFSTSLQTRRDEMIQIGNLNQVLMQNIGLTPNQRRTILSDNVIDVARVRYIPAVGQPSVLFRDDTVAAEFYQAPLYQQTPGTPQTFSLSSEPPLSWDVDIAPSQPGTYEAIALQTGTAFSPPSPTLLNIPDDFTWALIYGAIGDLLASEPEATDIQRADYCKKRYMDGLLLLQNIPWVMLGKINGVAVTCDSLFSVDRYLSGWDTVPSNFGPVIVTAGTDLIAAPINAGIGLTLLGNAPVPIQQTDYVQCSRSDWDIILLFGQVLAAFKDGGADFAEMLDLEKQAIMACSAENSRLQSTGAFADVIVQRGQSEDRQQNRYNTNQARQ